MQLQKNLRIVDINTTHVNLELCVAAIKDWCSSRRLQLNADMTELIWFGTWSNLKKLMQAETSLHLGSITIEPAAVVRNRGVYMDDELNMQVHIGKMAVICFFHLRQLRFTLTSSSMLRLISALIISRIEYCNSVLYGLPAITLSPLQRVLHAAVRLIANLGYRDHVTPAMKELHWLPIAYCIKYRLCLMMHVAVNNRSMAYITDILIPTSSRRFRSTPCADRVWKKSFFHRRPYGLERASKQYTQDWQFHNIQANTESSCVQTGLWCLFSSLTCLVNHSWTMFGYRNGRYISQYCYC